MLRLFVRLVTCALLLEAIYAASRTNPPAGAKVVRSGTVNSGEFRTVSDAVASLPSDGSSQAIFIYPGTYTEQVSISRSGPLTVRFPVLKSRQAFIPSLDLWLHNRHHHL